MAEALQVLCLSRDPATAAGVAAMLASLPDFAVATRTAGYDEGLQKMSAPDLAIVVLEDDPAAGLAVIEGVRRGSRATCLVAVSPDDDAETIARALRAGADEHFSLPLSQQDLLKVCIKVRELRRGNQPGTGRGGQLWTVYGPKGGVGVTTIAVNLAIALRLAGRDVALVDLDVYAGDVACFLNLTPTYTLRDAAASFQRLDSASLHGMMLRHASGLHVLAAPSAGRGESPLELTAEQTTGILELVSATHELTIVDTPGIPSPATRAALTAAERILLVTDLTVPALRGCARTLDWLRGEGVDPASAVDVIVNKHGNRSGEISPADAARTLNVPLRAVLPRDDAAGWAAANSGRPLAEVPEGEALQRAIAGLVTGASEPADAGRRRPTLLRLFSGAVRG